MQTAFLTGAGQCSLWHKAGPPACYICEMPAAVSERLVAACVFKLPRVVATSNRPLHGLDHSIMC
jgi:hypothetical protein